MNPTTHPTAVCSNMFAANSLVGSKSGSSSSSPDMDPKSGFWAKLGDFFKLGASRRNDAPHRESCTCLSPNKVRLRHYDLFFALMILLLLLLLLLLWIST